APPELPPVALAPAVLPPRPAAEPPLPPPSAPPRPELLVMPPDPATPPLPLTPASLPPSSGLRGNEPTRPAQPTAIMQTKAHPTCTQLRLLDMLIPNRELPA
ncbi:MAG TPA: hypothetical protein VEX18_12475, partial [Polyangiaceae bacterium]|nr:hypothetical protein [Polyangiaceae bacterium]